MSRARTDDGAELHWQASGDPDAPALLLSNSLGTRLEMWADQLGPFSERFHVLAYDSRGHGRSDAPGGGYTIERLGRDALAVLDAAGVKSAHFAGVSKGGMVGQWLGVHAPARIDSLVLANTAAVMGPPESWDQRIAAVSESGMATLADAVVERWFTPEFRKASPRQVETIRTMLLETPPQGYAGCCAAIRDMDQRADLPRITAPTLVVAGSRDPATPMDKAEEIAALTPGAVLASLEAAHLSNIEQAQAFTRLVIEFLENRHG